MDMVDEQEVLKSREARSKRANELGLGLSEEKLDEMPRETEQLKIVRSKVMEGVTIVERRKGDWVPALYTRVLTADGFKNPKKVEKWLKKRGIELMPIIAMATTCMVMEHQAMAAMPMGVKGGIN